MTREVTLRLLCSAAASMVLDVRLGPSPREEGRIRVCRLAQPTGCEDHDSTGRASRAHRQCLNHVTRPQNGLWHREITAYFLYAVGFDVFRVGGESFKLTLKMNPVPPYEGIPPPVFSVCFDLVSSTLSRGLF